MNGTECVNWVKMQADCLLHRLFDILHASVENDVREANEYSPFAEQGWTFTLSPLNGRAQFTVVRRPTPGSPDREDGVNFTHDRTAIVIQFHDSSRKSLRVEAKWDHETDTCGITINGERNAKGEFYKPWQISREALSSLIFP